MDADVIIDKDYDITTRSPHPYIPRCRQVRRRQPTIPDTLAKRMNVAMNLRVDRRSLINYDHFVIRVSLVQCHCDRVTQYLPPVIGRYDK